MTKAVHTIEADADLAQVAALFDRRRLKRLPVLKDGKDANGNPVTTWEIAR